MYSPLRALFLVLNLLGWSTLVFFGTASLVAPARALPIAFPMIHNADYAPAPNASTPVFAQHVSPGSPMVRRDVLDSIEQLGAAGEAIQRRDINTVLGDINILNNYYVQMTQHASNFHQLAQEPASSRSANFEQQSANEVSGFHTNLLGFQNTLAELGADKGLANYDRDDDIETLMKDLVNANKYLLNDIDEMVYDIPGLGPTLGPIVYEIKCILDEVLDTVENLTDAIINAIKPLLQGLIGDASQTACNSGIQLAGLCVLV
ncbi:uncharacterized protein PHACADRAFT_134144 [Phanerochaete carnosa HHB-10118-sp]|uniref:Uncharacterized protein n=1 Tax=Phanerochaete carnosa (strain HHB-10118-sp) TaxID=650164 RepID=K5VDH9_PHACS|nr:uncharacterized protein PHACADRAFT_134144 [Phanerochaete carnosa HHB-10118-sp]EKM61036.1 hypothetical protein PHACADRAFT_134144 [Phanerochaete carnosa HHB-10118-sp]